MKTGRMATLVMTALLLAPAVAGAGTWFAGAKGWYAWWDSSVLEWFEKDITGKFLEAGLELTTSKDPGTGYLLGPTVGYQTDDQKWSFSLALMLLGRFSQDWDAAAFRSTGENMNLSSDLTIERADYDLAANYSLRDDLKLFLGLKYQLVEMGLDLTYDTVAGRTGGRYRMEQEVLMPTVGVAYVRTLSDRWVLGGQAGILYAIPELTLRDPHGQSFDVWPRPAPGFNGEVTATWRMSPGALMQVGYRYQLFQLDTRAPETWKESVSNDTTQGLTLSVTWVL